MITLLIGDNSFEIERTLNEISASFDGDVEKIDGASLQLPRLPDILMGVSLFATRRMIIIRGLSDNKSVWSVFGEWLPRISDDIHLVLAESKPDKRTSTFKLLKDVAEVREFQAWTDRDALVAEKWVSAEAKKLGYELDKKGVQTLVNWVGIDQWKLFHALEKLALTDDKSSENIKNIIEPNSAENVFNLFETALRGDTNEIMRIVKSLEQTDDVYRLTGLLLSQVFQLTVVVSAEKTDNITKDFAIHPFVVSKLKPIAKRLGRGGISKIIAIFIELDDDLKISRAEPWLLIERALMKVANI